MLISPLFVITAISVGSVVALKDTDIVSFENTFKIDPLKTQIKNKLEGLTFLLKNSINEMWPIFLAEIDLFLDISEYTPGEDQVLSEYGKASTGLRNCIHLDTNGTLNLILYKAEYKPEELEVPYECQEKFTDMQNQLRNMNVDINALKKHAQYVKTNCSLPKLLRTDDAYGCTDVGEIQRVEASLRHRNDKLQKILDGLDSLKRQLKGPQLDKRSIYNLDVNLLFDIQNYQQNKKEINQLCNSYKRAKTTFLNLLTKDIKVAINTMLTRVREESNCKQNYLNLLSYINSTDMEYQKKRDTFREIFEETNRDCEPFLKALEE